jgi:hypothetical protein
VIEGTTRVGRQTLLEVVGRLRELLEHEPVVLDPGDDVGLTRDERLDALLDPPLRQDHADVDGPSGTSSGTDAARSSVNFVVTASSRQRRSSSIQISTASLSNPPCRSILTIATVPASHSR